MPFSGPLTYFLGSDYADFSPDETIGPRLKRIVCVDAQLFQFGQCVTPVSFGFEFFAEGLDGFLLGPVKILDGSHGCRELICHLTIYRYRVGLKGNAFVRSLTLQHLVGSDKLAGHNLLERCAAVGQDIL